VNGLEPAAQGENRVALAREQSVDTDSCLGRELFEAATFQPAPGFSQQADTTPAQTQDEGSKAKQDMHHAGQETKDAAHDAGNGVKHGTQKAYHSTKHGTKKAWNKTKSTTEGAAEGAKEGAKQPQ
jgi:hypothetical protein